MAVLPAFRTWTAGEIVTASYMNTNIRDSGNFFLATPIAELRQTVAQSIANASLVALLFDTNDLDTDGGHSTVTNTSRYTPQTAGYCQYTGAISWVANATGRRVNSWFQNGAAVNAGETAVPATAANVGEFVSRTKNILSNGTSDYVELIAYQESGGALSTNVGAASGQSNVSVRWVHT